MSVQHANLERKAGTRQLRERTRSNRESPNETRIGALLSGSKCSFQDVIQLLIITMSHSPGSQERSILARATPLGKTPIMSPKNSSGLFPRQQSCLFLSALTQRFLER